MELTVWRTLLVNEGIAVNATPVNTQVHFIIISTLLLLILYVCVFKCMFNVLALVQVYMPSPVKGLCLENPHGIGKSVVNAY
jgi:hypothetical protein